MNDTYVKEGGKEVDSKRGDHGRNESANRRNEEGLDHLSDRLILQEIWNVLREIT